jgi:hypothetical protein
MCNGCVNSQSAFYMYSEDLLFNSIHADELVNVISQITIVHSVLSRLQLYVSMVCENIPCYADTCLQVHIVLQPRRSLLTFSLP